MLCKVISTSESPLYPAEENKPSWRYKGAWLLCQLGSGAWLSVMPCGVSWREHGIGRQDPTCEAPPALAAYRCVILQNPLRTSLTSFRNDLISDVEIIILGWLQAGSQTLLHWLRTQKPHSSVCVTLEAPGASVLIYRIRCVFGILGPKMTSRTGM